MVVLGCLDPAKRRSGLATVPARTRTGAVHPSGGRRPPPGQRHRATGPRAPTSRARESRRGTGRASCGPSTGPSNVPVGIALAHPHQDLSILIHLEPPLTHGHLRQKSRKHSRFTKVRTPEVAPLGRKSTGAITPQFWWRHYAEIEMAPFCRKFTPRTRPDAGRAGRGGTAARSSRSGRCVVRTRRSRDSARSAALAGVLAPGALRSPPGPPTPAPGNRRWQFGP